VAYRFCVRVCLLSKSLNSFDTKSIFFKAETNAPIIFQLCPMNAFVSALKKIDFVSKEFRDFKKI